MSSSGILIIDYGSQYTLLIAKRLRTQGFYCQIAHAPCPKQPEDFSCRGVILSGGPRFLSARHEDALPPWLLAAELPILGICYGMQLLIAEAGGRLRNGEHAEFGEALLTWRHDPSLPAAGAAFAAGITSPQRVWMSHFDDVEYLPESYVVLARSNNDALAAVCHRHKKICAVQFHPEVTHSEGGERLLANFAGDLCGLAPHWQMDRFLVAALAAVHAQVRAGERVLVAVSGGVDSTVLAILLKRALGDGRVAAVMVDSGLQRLDEAAWVRQEFAALGMSLTVIEAQEEFFSALADLEDPEAKRKAIGRTFIEVLSSYARRHGSFSYLAQGTLYPDVIESAADGAGAKVIKSHHNVGGLPAQLDLPLLEPLRQLFKDEVRRLGEVLGLPAQLVYRHPFPGPGLAVRIPGVVTREAVAIVQQADAVFIAALREAGWYEQIWQAAAILLPVKSVGVMGDNRTYQRACVLRAVLSEDGMTARVSDLPVSLLTAIAGKIIAAVPGINRVLYDVTSKPPATIEWE